jgi:hypothetical protein
MSSLLQRSRRTGMILALAFGLAVLSAIVTPLLADQVSFLPGTDVVLANETQGGGG